MYIFEKNFIKECKSFWEEIGKTWEIFRNNWGGFLVIFSINFLAICICVLPLGMVIMKAGVNEKTSPEEMLNLFKNLDFLINIIIGGFLALATYTFSLSASFHLANGAKNWKIAFKKAFAMFGNMYVINLISVSIVSAGLFLFFIPGILALFFFSFIYPVAIIEKTGIIETIKKSYSAIKANWKFVASRLILFWGAFMLVNVVISALRIGYLAFDLFVIFLPIFYSIIYKEIKNK